MTLLIACMLIHGLNLPGFLYVVATALWIIRIGAVSLMQLAKQ